MPLLIRAASLTHFRETCSACGLQPEALVREVGLPLRCLDEPDLKVSSDAVALLLERAAQRGREPAFGLRMAASRRLSNLGPLGLLLRDEATLGDALQAMVRYIHLHNEAMQVHTESEAGRLLLHEHLMASPGVPLRQATELAVGVTYRLLAVLLGSRWRPRLVCFRHRAPRHLDMHHRVLGPHLAFGQDFDGLVCDEADLQADNPGADPVMARYTRQLLTSRSGARQAFTDSVRQLIVILMPRGQCRIEVLAQHLGMDRRTVARRLREEGQSFSQLHNELRCDLVARYLADGACALDDIAALLGFSQLSAFSRWHRQQFAQTASQRQAAQRKRVQPRSPQVQRSRPS